MPEGTQLYWSNSVTNPAEVYRVCVALQGKSAAEQVADLLRQVRERAWNMEEAVSLFLGARSKDKLLGAIRLELAIAMSSQTSQGSARATLSNTRRPESVTA